MGSPRGRHHLTTLAAVALTAMASLPAVTGWSAAPASATVGATSHFIWTTTPSNTTGFLTVINNGATNGLPKAMLFVTQNDTPGGVCGCVVDQVPIGITYGGGRWLIFNEDLSTNMPIGASFNVLVVQHANADVFVQTATTTNTVGDSTSITSTATDGKPKALLQVTQRSTGGSQSVNNNRSVGVTFANNKAAIFNEDTSPMPVGAEFNVMVGASKSNGGALYLQQTVFGSGSDSTISNSHTTGNPNAVIFVTPNFDAAYLGGVFDAAPSGVTYVAGPTDKWAVSNQDGSAMGNGPAFNLLMFSS